MPNNMTNRVSDRFLQAYAEIGRDPERGWEDGMVEPYEQTPGMGSQTPPTRDNGGAPIKPPDLGTMEIPGYEWEDTSKAFHSIVAASLHIAGNPHLERAADAIRQANRLLEEAADILDHRPYREEPSLSDTYGEASRVSTLLRERVSRELAQCEAALNRLR